MLRNFLGSEILSARKLINVRYPRDFRSTRDSSTHERCESVHRPPDDECPPKKRCLMDLYPVPCGSWKEHYDANNAIYNRQLIAAIGVFIVSFVAVNRVGWVKGYREVDLF